MSSLLDYYKPIVFKRKSKEVEASIENFFSKVAASY